MNKKVTIVLGALALLLTLDFDASAQLSEEVNKKTPELPGEIQVDFGFNMLTGKPDYWNDIHWWRSKSVAIYFVKPFDLSKKMEFRPGIGVSLEKIGSRNANFIDPDGTLTDLGSNIDIIKGQMAFNYIELPIEIRYNMTGNDSKSSPYISVGGMFGYAFETKAKIKYEDKDLGEKAKIKVKGDADFLDTPKFRIGLQARVGLGGVSLFYKQYITPVIKENQFADNNKIINHTIGISISGL
ncbi:PorT family protein [Reichenbachiella agarivorans]|uniref:PorT family protein n=1 Tax=Reichenbachiella agarivorans TaxID=2979464 RepID=A0ABY6CW78_9BACT|nr:PorT family protein [Reichenbachiella agarivorans]UXP33643.1 PorT family protein [Reichenbachiella agarivorans]